jgi:hypothetical protein
MKRIVNADGRMQAGINDGFNDAATISPVAPKVSVWWGMDAE